MLRARDRCRFPRYTEKVYGQERIKSFGKEKRYSSIEHELFSANIFKIKTISK